MPYADILRRVEADPTLKELSDSVAQNNWVHKVVSLFRLSEKRKKSQLNRLCQLQLSAYKVRKGAGDASEFHQESTLNTSGYREELH